MRMTAATAVSRRQWRTGFRRRRPSGYSFAAPAVVPDAADVNDLSPPNRPAWFDVLLARVDRAFAVTGADTPGWPDPHPDRNPPDEEYSRVSDPRKYRILDARVDAWVQALAEAGLAEARDVPAQPWIAAPRRPVDLLRVRRITPMRPGGLTVLFATTLVDAAPFGLDVAIAEGEGRPVFLEPVPDCGCDACDSGSADLLATMDGWVLTVARGGVVHVRSGESYATRTVDGWQTAGGGHESWLDGSAALPAGVERWVGTPWP
jgi:hypothetical protein